MPSSQGQRSSSPLTNHSQSSLPSSDLPQSPGDDSTAEQCFKRLYLALKDKVDHGEISAGNKRKAQRSTTTTQHELRCLDADYVDNELDELDDDEKEMAVRSQERNYRSFRELCRLIPNLQTKLEKDEPQDLMDFFSQDSGKAQRS